MAQLRGIERYFSKNAAGRWKQVVIDGGVPENGTPVMPPLHVLPTEPPSGTPEEGDIYFDDDLHELMVHNGTVYVPVAGNTTFYWNFLLKPFATVTEYDLAVIKRALKVVSIDCVPSTLQGGALTATVVKASGTSAPANGTTPLHTANAINLNTGAYTNQSITLTSTTADLAFAAGNRLGIDYSAAYTVGHAALTIGYQYV